MNKPCSSHGINSCNLDALSHSGKQMMSSYLKSEGIKVQRRRVRAAMEASDAVGMARRWGKAVTRRSYSVPGPNSLWHMDGHMKLCR